MSLCATLQSNKRAVCDNTAGGIAKLYLFDPYDFTFDTPAGDDTHFNAYHQFNTSFPNLHLFYELAFQNGEANYTMKQSSKKGQATLYEHEITFTAPNVSMLQTQFNIQIDAAGGCCGVGVVIVLNSGKIFIAGEKVMNYEEIINPLHLFMDGTTGNSGKQYSDINGTTVSFKGTWTRPLIEYTGTPVFITVNPFG